MAKKQAESGKAIFRNVLYGFSTWILPLGLSFVGTPIIVRALGDEDYGIYSLVLGFVAYSFNFGIGRAITKYIAEYRASGESEKIREVISATLFLNIVVGLTGVSIICLSATWLVSDVFWIDPASQTKTIYSFYAAAGIIFISMLIQVFNAILQGIHRFDVYSKIFNFNIFSLIVGNIVLAVYGYGLLSLLIWNFAISVITCVIYFISAKKLLPEFQIGFRFSGETLKLVLRFSLGVIGYQILANVLLLFERGWITRKLGAEALTYYVVPMMLSLYIHSFISSLMIVIFPLASELTDNKEKLLDLYRKATKIVCLLVVFLAMTLMVQNYEFLALWMGAAFAEKSSTLLIIHTVTFGLLAILTVSWQLTEGLGFPNYNFKMFAICLIITITGMVFLTSDYGSVGIAISRMAGFSAIFFSIFYVEKWFFEKIQFDLWSKIAVTLTISACLAASVEGLIVRNLPVTWLTLLLSTFCGGVVYCSFLWIMGFVTDDEKFLVKTILSR
jgi:O-antigen/teichoic acid export membrane protein